jgi:hypothetical protein
MTTGQEILKQLRSQQGHYLALKAAIVKQTGHIEEGDIDGLTAGTSEVRGLMRQIRDGESRLRPLKQSWANLDLDKPVLEKREISSMIASIRDSITEIQEIKDQNKERLEAGMVRVKKEMTERKTQSKAVRAYRSQGHKQLDQPARFIDKSN